MSQIPRRRRPNIVALCKAIIKYAEGPGEIDSLVDDLCDNLAELSLAMKDTHNRALREEEIRDKQVAYEENLFIRAPLDTLQSLIEEEAEERGIDIEDWSELDDIKW